MALRPRARGEQPRPAPSIWGHLRRYLPRRAAHDALEWLKMAWLRDSPVAPVLALLEIFAQDAVGGPCGGPG